MNQISFLIGSGFSVPIGIPTTNEINRQLQKIRESEICIHSSQDARFLRPGETNPNSQWMKIEQRKFVEEFINFYNESVLTGNDEFNYEDFFDYYNSFLTESDYSSDLSRFMENFIKANGLRNYTADSLLFNFNLTFQQLICDLLQKKFETCMPGQTVSYKLQGFFNAYRQLGLL